MNKKTQNKKRCKWATSVNPLYTAYHDEEWGVPCYNDKTLFEFLILEGAQAGLSWSTILNKRKGYQKAFDQFDAHKIARYNKSKINKRIQNPDIVRNKLKIQVTVINAQQFLEVKAEYGKFSKYIWQFVGGKPIQNKWKTLIQNASRK